MTTTAHDIGQVPPGAQVVLPPHGFTCLLRSAASDLDVVNAARVSFAKQSTWIWCVNGEIFYDEASAHDRAAQIESDPGSTAEIDGPVLAADDEGVCRFMLRNRHGSPFEHTFFKWHIRAPIAVFREWHRHRIGMSYNEESARYTPLAGDFYVPERDHVRGQHGKPGHYTFSRIDDDDMAASVQAQLQQSYDLSYSTYQLLMSLGIAKEQARLVLPVGIYSQMIFSCNARSLMAFLSLRNDAPAMHEIKVYAQALERNFAKLMPITHDEFTKNGRVAP